MICWATFRALMICCELGGFEGCPSITLGYFVASFRKRKVKSSSGGVALRNSEATLSNNVLFERPPAYPLAWRPLFADEAIFRFALY